MLCLPTTTTVTHQSRVCRVAALRRLQQLSLACARPWRRLPEPKTVDEYADDAARYAGCTTSITRRVRRWSTHAGFYSSAVGWCPSRCCSHFLPTTAFCLEHQARVMATGRLGRIQQGRPCGRLVLAWWGVCSRRGFLRPNIAVYRLLGISASRVRCELKINALRRGCGLSGATANYSTAGRERIG